MPAEKLPDLLAAGLDLVLVGTAAGERSAREGNYYAHPSNRFWRTLADVGLTPREFRPSEYRELLRVGIGATDLCKTQSGRDHAISKYDLPGFERKIRRYRPRTVAFTSKTGGSIWSGVSTGKIRCGHQPLTREDFPVVFVLTSPSGAASGHWDIAPWRELAEWVRSCRQA